MNAMKRILPGAGQKGLPAEKWQAGMTLIEVLVGMTIISILSFLAATTFPYVRQYQQATLTAQLIQSTMRRAQQLALDETRDEKCLATVEGDVEQQRRCSDVGVATTGQNMVLYADTVDDNRHTADRDFIIATLPIAGSVAVTAKSFLFEATPPAMTMFVNGDVRATNQTEPLTVRAGRAAIQLTVSSYGLIQQTTPTP